jgi:hypothetical protein
MNATIVLATRFRIALSSLTYFQPDDRSNELEYAQDKPSRPSRQANGIRLQLLAGQQAKSEKSSYQNLAFPHSDKCRFSAPMGFQ